MADNIYRYLMISIGICLLIFAIGSFYPKEEQFDTFFSQVKYTYTEEREWGVEISPNDLLDDQLYDIYNPENYENYSTFEIKKMLMGEMVYSNRSQVYKAIYKERTYSKDDLWELKESLKADWFFDVKVVIDREKNTYSMKIIEVGEEG